MQAKPKSVDKLISFGVIADIQYGDVEPHGDSCPREAIERLEDCIRDFNSRDLAFTIQLGDIVEGQESLQKTRDDLDRILSVYNKLQMQRYHVVGNHGIVHAGRETLQGKLELTQPYYVFTHPAAKDWRFMVLDGNEGEGGYEGVLRETQLAWLANELDKAAKRKEKVIVFSHYALLEAAAPIDLMYAPEPVLKLIEKSGCVAAYFAGHDHKGGYAFHNGIHHLTFKGVVEAPKQNAYAVIELFPNHLKVIGYGKEPSRTCYLPA